jgi:hypothetical protein
MKWPSPSVAVGLAFATCLASATSLAETTDAGAGVTAPPAPLGESLRGEARTSYDIGKILYRDGDHAGALAKFRRAYELTADPRLLWNMAACEKNLRRYRRVLLLVERYLADGKDKLTAEDVAQARAFMDAVRQLVSEVRVDVNEPGAEVLLDDEPVGTSPLSSPILVDIGSHRFRARKAGFAEAALVRELDGGSKAEVSLVLTPERHDGRLVVTASPGERIAVDERPPAKGTFDATLPSGRHHVVVTGEGRKPRTLDVVVRDGERRELHVDLEKDGRTMWPWIVAGGVGATALAVGAVLLLRPTTPAPTPGTGGTFELP